MKGNISFKTKLAWFVVLLLGAGLGGFSAGFIYGSHKSFSKFPLVSMGESVYWSSNKVRWDGWSVAESVHRWNDGKKAWIVVNLAPIDKKVKSMYAEFSIVMANGAQPLQIKINKNGRPDDVVNLNVSEPGIYRVEFPRELLRDGENVVELDLPNSAWPHKGDQRELGIALKSFRIGVVD